MIKNLKTGEISTKELIDLFGTQKLKERYKKEKRLGGKDKQQLLNKAKKFCDIKDLGQGKHIIHKLYIITNEGNKEALILPLMKGLSKYLTPLILTKLLNEQDQNYKITLPFLGWARKLEMVNENYPLIKYHQKQSSEYLKIDGDIMFDYFERMDECIKYHLEKCLNVLSKKSGLDLLEFDTVTMAKKFILQPTIENNNIDIICGKTDEILIGEDRKFAIDCENKAKELAGIIDNKEKFYGVKSHIYKKELKKLLSERNILFTYSAYNIYCKNPEEIKNILTTYDSMFNYQEESFIQVFNENFIEYIENKAKMRQNRESKKLEELEDENANISFIKKYRLTETYISDFKALSDLTVHKDSQSLKNSIKIDKLEDIMDEFNISIIKI